MIVFLLIAAGSFVAMEFVSYLAHRYIYHKLLWVFHKSHHSPRKGAFELNDVFPVFFAAAAITLMAIGVADPGRSHLLAMSIGITAYGMVYFFIHDLYVHRRVRSLPLRIPFLLTIKKAHAIHHRTGGEPYGLLFFANPENARRERVKEDDVV
jgi:beta-carotene 3-hydroxylase